MKRRLVDAVLPEAIVIGGSAGSIPVICEILNGLNNVLQVPLIICIHRMRSVPEGIREVFASVTELPVIEPNDKDSIRKGVIYVAPSNYHLLIEQDHSFALSTEDLVNYSRPAIDVTFITAAKVFNDKLAGIILTGANRDGAIGMVEMEKAGAMCIVQDPLTSSAPYMPQAAIEAANIDSVLSVAEIISFISARSSDCKT